jgi:hypothetical protein
MPLHFLSGTWRIGRDRSFNTHLLLIISRDTHWVAAVRDYYEAYEKGTPQFRLNLWEATFQTPSYVSAFHAPERFTTEWVLPTTKSAVQDRVLSKSYITMISEEEKEVLKRNIDEALEKEEQVWIDRSSGVFEYPYKTTVVSMTKLS